MPNQPAFPGLRDAMKKTQPRREIAEIAPLYASGRDAKAAFGLRRGSGSAEQYRGAVHLLPPELQLS